ncbi:MAG: hypothetical protein OEU86_01840 [Gammaproteobacteria bacterium]|nr:hypothetical protein [Gammaproteobacteria bacterium]
MIDPAWEGKVQFYELIWGTWLTYAFMVFMWEKLLRAPKPEWVYTLITFFGASFFWVNHYFQFAPFYFWLLNGYTLVFVIIYFMTCVRGEARSVVWKIGATLTSVVFTIAFILFENIGRWVVDDRALGLDGLGLGHTGEFLVMLGAYFGFIWLILWRGRRAARQTATS